MKRIFGKQALVLVLGVTVALLTACTSASYTIPTSDTNTPPTTAPVGQAVTVDISAQNIAFDKNTITVPAGANVTLVFNNKEAIPHNVAIYTTEAATEVIFVGQVITGPKTITYNFTAPTTPGTYFFRCDVHPSMMKGSFIVTGTDSPSG